MTLRDAPDPADLEAVRRWFARLAECVRAVDYAAALPLFDVEFVAFGTFDDFVSGREAAMQAQWMNVWPTIRNFRWRLDQVTAIVAPDRLAATGLAVFDSDGFVADGRRFDRRGRATVALRRRETGADWVAVHTHMSLFRGTPDRSFGPPGGG